MSRSSERFRALLREHRLARGWSQERAAEESGVDHSLWSRLESGQRRATREAIAKLARGKAGDSALRGLGLADAEYDELLLAAGYRALDPAAAIRGVPEAARLYDLLRDDGALGEEGRALLRRAVSGAMDLCELATARGG